MFIFVSTIFIALLSIGMAFISLKNIQKEFSAKETKAALRKERVIFHSSDRS